MKRLLFVTVAVMCCALLTSFTPSAGQIPPKPNPPRLVNDYANIFTAGERAEMENMLVAFNDSTSNQITVVTVNDLQGYTAQQFAYETGEQWGVGNKKYNNGIVVVLKPRNENGGGEVNISTGYGLEGAIPDAVCKRIIEEEMVPLYARGRYYEGTLKGVKVLMKLASGEISAASYDKTDWSDIAISIAALLGFVIFIIILSYRKRPPKDGTGSVKRGVFWGGVGGFGGGSSSSSGGGSWGGSGRSGGFGGFGGGSFGGGGASGRF
ncbi:MAG: TPM domain-containing protein [Bacteroidales bacterium]|nr:TPM domain-containing protein [Bacteroidales bacterium]